MWRRRWTPEQAIADWRRRYLAGRCDLEALEWAIAHILREVETGTWP